MMDFTLCPKLYRVMLKRFLQMILVLLAYALSIAPATLFLKVVSDLGVIKWDTAAFVLEMIYWPILELGSSDLFRDSFYFYLNLWGLMEP